MEPVNIRLNVRGSVGIVTCDEEVYTRRFVRAGSGVSGGQGVKKVDTVGKGKGQDGPGNDTGAVRSGRVQGMELVNRLTATNVFRKVSDKWYMVHHHSTFHADSDVAKKTRMDSATTDEERIRQRLPKGASAIEGLTTENVLGIPGHEGFYDKNKGAATKKGLGGIAQDLPGQSGGGFRRVFTGSLDELLNGGLKDMLGGVEGGGNEDDEEEFILQEENEDDDDDDMDDSIQEETIIISNNILSGNGQSNGDMAGYGGIVQNGIIDNGIVGNNKDNTKKKIDANSAKEDPSKDSLRQSCIAQLRDLATQGIISKKQKRTLLTDIILSSAKGEYSMVEVAYDLLCGENDDEDDGDVAAEEFAEQCRVFAMAMPEIPPIKSQ